MWRVEPSWGIPPRERGMGRKELISGLSWTSSGSHGGSNHYGDWRLGQSGAQPERETAGQGWHISQAQTHGMLFRVRNQHSSLLGVSNFIHKHYTRKVLLITNLV